MGWLQPAHLVPNLLTQHNTAGSKQAIAKRSLHTQILESKYTYTIVYLHPHTVCVKKEGERERERGKEGREGGDVKT